MESTQALIGAALLMGGLVLVPMVIALGKYWIPERNNFFARWGFTHFLTVALAWLAAMLVLSSIWGGLSDEPLGITESLALSSVVFAIPAGLVFVFASRLDPTGWRCLGFRKSGTGRSVLFGLCAYFLLLPALFGTTLFWPWLLEQLGGEPQAQEVMKSFIGLEGAGQWLLPAIFAVLVLPFFEELLFRAFLQPLLVQNFREVGGIVITSALFAALHGISVFLPVFGLALIMGSVMQRTQRFAACWAIHATHNGLILGLVLFAPFAQEMIDSTGLLALLSFP